MVKKQITNVTLEHKSIERHVLFIIDYDLIIFGFIHIPMATGGIVSCDNFTVNDSTAIFEIANIILN